MEHADSTAVLTFRLERNRYALPVDRTSGVRDLDRVRRIPDAPPAWYGLTDWNGRALNLVNLPVLLEDASSSDAQTVLRLREPFADIALFVPARIGLGEVRVPDDAPTDQPLVALGSAGSRLYLIHLDNLMSSLVGVAIR